MAYVYRHIRLDTMNPFYIGVGSDNEGKYSRSKVKNENRNKHWHSIVDKCGYRIDILMDDLTREQALEKEIEFIKLYGRVNSQTGILCNLTDGGEGFLGYVYTEEVIAKMKLASKMPSRINASVLNWKKLKDKLENETVEERKFRLEKVGKALLGSKRTKEQKENMSKALRGKPKSEAHKKALSEMMKKAYASGERKPSVVPKEKKIKKGHFKHTEETKMKLSALSKGRKISESQKEKLRKHMLSLKVNYTKTEQAVQKQKETHIKNRIKHHYFKGYIYSYLLEDKSKELGRYITMTECSKHTGVNHNSISQILEGKIQSCKGWTFIRKQS